MATPERRTATGTPALPSAPASAVGPVPVVAPFGWLLIMVSGIGLVLATWMLYGNSEDAMWAGYRDGAIGTVVILAAMALRTSVRPTPFLGLTGLCGILLVLFAVFLDDGQKVFVTELVAGVGLLVGTGLKATESRD